MNQFIGYAMIAVGVLITLLSGGCTLAVLWMSMGPNGNLSFLTSALGVGLFFILLGVGLFFGGRNLLLTDVSGPSDEA